MTKIFKKMILRALNAATRRVQGIAESTIVAMDSSTNTKKIPSTTLQAANTEPAQDATEPASSDGAPNAAGNGEEKIHVPTGNKRSTRVAIMEKDNKFALIVIDTNLPVNQATVNVVTSQDPRCKPSAHYQNFETPPLATAAFNECLAVSRDRGWTVAHLGERNYG